jgi:hypothetical protein
LEPWTRLGISGAQVIVAALIPFLVIAPAYAPNILASDSLPAGALKLGWRFDNGVEWLGASVDRTTIRPGDEINVTIYARVPAGSVTRNTLFIHIVNSADVIVAQRDSFIGGGNLDRQTSPITIADSYRVLVPVTVPAPDEWRVSVGMYDPITGNRAEATDSAGRLLGNALTLSKLQVQPAAADAWNFDFDGRATLVGADFDQTSIARGRALSLTLHWLNAPTLAPGAHVFVHALGEGSDHIWATADVPLDTSSPMQLGLQFDPQTPPGIYQLELGIYIPPYGDRFAVFDRRGQDVGDRLFLGPIRVTEN